MVLCIRVEEDISATSNLIYTCIDVWHNFIYAYNEYKYNFDVCRNAFSHAVYY